MFTEEQPPARARPGVAARGWGLLALALFVTGLCVNPMPANDLFWQLRAGREIVATHHVPRHDTYSWTRRGAPWVAHEWLAFVLLWEAYRLGGGYAGVWLLQAILALATCLVLYGLLLRETGEAPLTAFLLAVGAALLASAFFQPRPHLLTYLFLTLTTGIALQARRQSCANRAWLLVPLFALWANLHAGVLVGVGLLAAFVLGDAIEGRPASLLGPVALACAAATLATPYGWHLYQDFGATVGNATAMARVSEWKSPDFHEPFGQVLEAWMAVVAWGFVFSREKRDVAEMLIILALAYAALAASRNAPLFALTGTLVAARHVQSALSQVLSRIRRPSLFGDRPPVPMLALVALTVASVSVVRVARALTLASHAASPLEGLARLSIGLRSFPEDACRFLEAEQFPTAMRLYNSYGDGGFLAWRVPQYPVFIDGRADVYFGRVLDDYANMNTLPYGWRDILNAYDPDIVLTAAGEPQARLFLTAPDWALVYTDRPDLDAKLEGEGSSALVFVRRLPRYAPLIARARRHCPALRPGSRLARCRDYAALR